MIVRVKKAVAPTVAVSTESEISYANVDPASVETNAKPRWTCVAKLHAKTMENVKTFKTEPTPVCVKTNISGDGANRNAQ